MFRRNSRARVFIGETVLDSNSSPNARVWIWAGDRVVENPGLVYAYRLYGAFAVGSPVPFVYAGNDGQGLVPVSSLHRMYAIDSPWSRASGWPLPGLALFAMLVHSFR